MKLYKANSHILYESVIKQTHHENGILLNSFPLNCHISEEITIKELKKLHLGELKKKKDRHRAGTTCPFLM